MPSESQPFRHYSLRHRIVAWVSQNLFDKLTYTVRHGLLSGLKRKGGLGWVPAAFSRAAETAEERFWRSLDLRGQTVYDVGAFQGLLTLFFARQARQVVCYEPNERNRRRLEENVRLNRLDNVTVRSVGLGSEPQNLEMRFDPRMSGGASVDRTIAAGVAASGARVETQVIAVTTLDLEVAAGRPAPDFVKIDVEGWELEALRGGRETLASSRPRLFLEMHGETMADKRRKVAEIVAFLHELGYHNIRHVESGAAITADNTALAAQGHLDCVYGQAATLPHEAHSVSA